MKTCSYRTVVIGSGCAGLNGADWLAMLGETDFALVTENMQSGTSRNTGSDKQTYYKLSLAGDEGDSVGDLAATLARPDVHGDNALCEAANSAACFLRLAGMGIPFPTNEFGEYVGYQTDHDTRLRATSAGPLTSKLMTEALEKSARDHGVQVLDHLHICRILTDAEGVCGVLGLDTEKREWVHIRCAHVMLCTGGPAHIYRDRVYPESQFGGSGMAFAAGAAGANLHCWQYGLASVKFRWNVSGSYQQCVPRYVSKDENGIERDFLTEALGAKEALNRTFLKGYQWPFDERKVNGSSRVDLLVKAETDKGRRVYMDFTRDPIGWGAEMLSDEAKNYLSNCDALIDTPIKRLLRINPPAIGLYREHGIDLRREMLEVRVCAQHHNGGIAVDADWQTEIPGLYACGEAAGTFGKCRPGGTALNSTQVGSMRAARHIARVSKRTVRECAEPDLPLLPTGDAAALTAYYQGQMTRAASFDRKKTDMERLLTQVNAQLNQTAAADRNDPQLIDRLRLHDLLLCQREVLSAMLADAEAPSDIGVLRTQNGRSGRVPARPIPTRDQWFERVWRQYRARNGEE